VNKALKGYSKRQFSAKLDIQNYMNSAWRESCHSFTTGPIGDFEWTRKVEKNFERAIKQVRKLRNNIKGGAE
jgi:hypothetical protein